MAALSSSALLQVTVSTAAQPLESPLRYLGSDPYASTNDVATKGFADSYFQANSLVTQQWVDNQTDAAVANALTRSSMNSLLSAKDSSGNSVYLTVAQLKTIMANYADSSIFGTRSTATTRLAQANNLGAVSVSDTPSYVPTNIITDNVPVSYNCLTGPNSIVNLTSSYTVGTGTLPNTYLAATFTIPDPGYLYYPMNFVYIQGKSAGTASIRTQNSNPANTGRILVATDPPSGGNFLPTNWFAAGICTSSPYPNWYMALPYINSWQLTSLPVMPISGTTGLTGDLTLHLYLSNASGGGYTFYGGTGFMWSVIVMPTAKMSFASPS